MISRRRKTDTDAGWPPVNFVPANETPDQRDERIRREVAAKETNDRIDRELKAEKERRKKPKAKILLLGQAESGKSTVLKNFQLQFAPKAFAKEATIWRPVIHLNLVRSVNFILNFLSTRLPNLRDTGSAQNTQLYGDLRKLCARLSPLRQVEDSLRRALSGSSTNSPFDPAYSPSKAPEVSFPCGFGWKKALAARRSHESVKSGGSDTSEFGQANRILAACSEDIIRLWKDSTVQHLLSSADITLEEQPGFFLDQAERITEEQYCPLPDDVLKARVTTVGPEEHIIQSENVADATAREWVIYDVGGSRSQRAAWAQFFDDVNIVIFLAPMSGFNQVLSEDESVNRLTDTLRLWQTICSNKILAGVEFVVFLNKLDILDAKLRSGVQFSQFVTSYTDKPNDTKHVARYLLDVFVSIHQHHSPRRRKLHPHLTCAVDTQATSTVISRVREVILVKILSQTNIL